MRITLKEARNVSCITDEIMKGHFIATTWNLKQFTVPCLQPKLTLDNMFIVT